MINVSYLRAGLDDIQFAVPSSALIKILPNPTAVSLPDAPEGICGIIYDKGAILAIQTFRRARKSPARLVILCMAESGPVAYAADRVEAVGELADSEIADASPAGAAGILLLDGKNRHD